MKYFAFISYSHADEAWARWLHKALESYRVPARLVGEASKFGPVPKRLFPVFRDRDELASSHELGVEIEAALNASRCLIVICSPRAAASRWVNEEIRVFKSLGRGDQVFCLIVDGEPGDPARECFPEAIRYKHGSAAEPDAVLAEPIAADARPGKDGKPDAKLKLIAGVLGVGFAELRQRELIARNRRLAGVAAGSALVALSTAALAVLAVNARNEAEQQRGIAETRQSQAEQLIGFMLGDLRDKLEPIGKLDVLGAVGDQAMAYFSAAEPELLSDRELAAQARAFRQIGDVRRSQGDNAGSITVFERALALSQALADRHPDDLEIRLDSLQALSSMAHAHYLAGDYEQATRWREQHRPAAIAVAQQWPNSLPAVAAVPEAIADLGATRSGARDWEAAETQLLDALSRYRTLLQGAGNPDDRDLLRAGLANSLSHLSYVYGSTGQWARVDEASAELLGIARVRQAAEPDNAEREQDLVEALMQRMSARERLANIPPADPDLAELIGLTRAQVERDPTNVLWLLRRLDSLDYQARALNVAGRAEKVLPIRQLQADLARDLMQRAPEDVASYIAIGQKSEQLAMAAWIARQPALAQQAVAAAIDTFGRAGEVVEAFRDKALIRLHLMAWLSDMAPDSLPDGPRWRQALQDPAARAGLPARFRLVLGMLAADSQFLVQAWHDLGEFNRTRDVEQTVCERTGQCPDEPV